MQNTKQAIFSLGDYEYGFNINDVSIIEEAIPIEPAANLPKNLKGIIHLRGDVIPVYSLRRKFGLDEIPTNDETRFIITNSDDMLIAYEVDQMNEIVEPEQDQVFEVPSIIMNKDTTYMKSVTNVEGRLVVIMDHNLIMTEDEKAKVKSSIKK